jgi:hypothetical protein
VECPWRFVSGDAGYRYSRDLMEVEDFMELGDEPIGLGGLSMPVLSEGGARRSR